LSKLLRRLSIRRCEQPPRGACGAIGLIVRVMQRRADLLDVRTRVGSLPALKKRRKRQEYLRDGEEEKRRTPERTR
jgi:hypothetical protein